MGGPLLASDLFGCDEWALVMRTLRLWVLAVLATSSGALFACATPQGPTRIPGPTVVLDVLPGGGSAGRKYPIEQVFEDVSFAFSPAGTKVHTYTLKYKIRTMKGLKRWGRVSAVWSPWFEDRPVVRATVTRPDGSTFELDHAGLAERPLESKQKGLYTERRQIDGPLPGLVVGATVERTVVLQERQPYLLGGGLVRATFGLGVPVVRSTLQVSLPEAMHARYQVRGIDLTPIETHDKGRSVLTFTVNDLPALGPTRMLLAPEQPRHAHVLVSTAKDWNTVAASYLDLVNKQIAEAKVSSLLKGLDRSREPRKIIAELMARVHAEIRYVGLELGEQDILPRPPQETLGRRFGDAKDKSALLVALLKGAGIKAHLAVLRAGFDQDVVPEIPGFEGFNHVLVHVPGPDPLWIDVTEELLPVGSLPIEVQGRNALVIASETSGLVQLPTAVAADNHYLEVRQVTFADWGPVSVQERTEAQGTMEHRLRRQLLGTGAEQVRRSLSGYIKRAYRSKTLGRFDHGDPRDVQTPFAVEVQALDALIGYTGRKTAKLQLRTPVLFGFVPGFLRDAALGTIEGKEAEAERRAAALLVSTRRTDMVLPQAFSAEVRYEVKLPLGFEVKSLPKAVEIRLGPGAYSVKFGEPSKDRLIVTLGLTTGPRRMTAKQAYAFVQGLSKVWTLDVPAVEFVHTGARLMKAGDTKAGIAYYGGLAKSQAEHPLHRARFAEALVASGLGEVGRREAHAAMLAAPDSVPVLMSLARVLEHDAFGRPRAAGFDRSGAIDVFRKVISIDGDNIAAQLGVARLLELDDRGRPSQDPAAWKAAADSYRTLRNKTGDTEFDLRLMHALHWGGDAQGLHRLASRLPPEGPNVAMQLVGGAQTQGVGLTLSEIDALGLPVKVRQRALETAAVSLARVRAYSEAREVMLAALPTSEDPESLQRRLSNLLKISKVKRESLSATGPASVVQRLLFSVLKPPMDAKEVATLLSIRAFEGVDLQRQVEAMSQGLYGFQRSGNSGAVPISMVRDNVLSLTQFEVEGSDRTGYKVTGRMPGASGDRISIWYVVKARSGYVIRASASTPTALGEEALYLLKRGNVEGARRWLGWAQDLLPERRGEDVLAVAPFKVLRKAKVPLTVQASALVAMGPRAADVLHHLVKAHKVVETKAGKTALAHALWLAYAGTERTKQAVLQSLELLELVPESRRAIGMHCSSLVADGRYQEAQVFGHLRVDVRPQDELGLTCLGEQALAAGDLKAARTWLKRQVDAGHGDSVTLNNLAWLALFSGPVSSTDVEAALRSNTLTGFKDPSKLHTLAALYAEQGNTREAHRLFIKRLELRGADEPEPVDWFLLGRIMEHYELFDDARAAYLRVLPEARAVDSTHRLAATRLKILQSR